MGSNAVLTGNSESILGLLDVAITIQNQKGALVYANESAARLMGFDSASDVVSASPKEAQRHFQIYAENGKILPLTKLPGTQALSMHKPCELCVKFVIQSTAQERWILAKSSPIVRGNVTLGVMNTFHELTNSTVGITKRKRIEATLRLSEKKFKTIFSTALNTILIFDDSFKIRDSNPAASELFSLPKKILLEQLITHIVIPDQREEWKTMLDTLLLKGSARGETDVKSSKNGTRTLAYNAVANILPHRHVMIMRDITERKLEKKRSEHFLGIASHELKSPLASIKAIAQLLKSRELLLGATVEQNYLDKVDKKVDLVTYLINDLLDITRIRQGKMEFSYELYNLDQLIQSVTDEQAMSDPNHTFVISLNANKTIMGDRIRISQVVQNIIRNAIKYSPANTKITISSTTKKQEVWISIEDEGPGISTKDKDKIFDLYYRSANSNTQSHHGLGVGLYISSEIIKQHNGAIWVEDGKKGGSMFHIVLPIHPKKESKTRKLF